MSEDDGWLHDYAKKLNALGPLKIKMRDRGLTRAKANCPNCQGKDTLQLGLAPSKRSGGALRWSCECGFKGME